jgi:hypothetical protein
MTTDRDVVHIHHFGSCAEVDFLFTRADAACSASDGWLWSLQSLLLRQRTITLTGALSPLLFLLHAHASSPHAFATAIAAAAISAAAAAARGCSAQIRLVAFTLILCTAKFAMRARCRCAVDLIHRVVHIHCRRGALALSRVERFTCCSSL